MTREASANRNNLGRGLAALLGEQKSENTGQTTPHFQNVPITDLHPCPHQPRRRFVEEHISELAQSIREKGILQPLVVRPNQEQSGTYEIICGERRWRAAQLAQKHEVPAIIRTFTDQEVIEIALVENLQRENLTPLEEAEAYNRLKDEFGHTQEELASGIGKSRSHVANMIRLLGLPETVKEMLGDGVLSVGHARALLGLDKEFQLNIAKEVLEKELSVRQTEALVKKVNFNKNRLAKSDIVKPDPDITILERSLSEKFGSKINVKCNQQGGGSLVINFRSLDELDGIIGRFK